LGKEVTSADGKGFTQLEPLMGAFAHLVGFSEDYKTIMHLHPKGPLLLDPAVRGGPELEFQICALRPGFVRLFAQVQIEGHSRFFPSAFRSRLERAIRFEDRLIKHPRFIFAHTMA
jgi:hypothetical protein